MAQQRQIRMWIIVAYFCPLKRNYYDGSNIPLTIRAALISEFYIVANLYKLINHPKLSAVD